MIDTLLTPLYYGVTAILLGWRWVFSHIGFSPSSGATWALSIVGLVVVIRIILIPLFVKQIKSSRKMVAIQPKMKALQEKHKGDRERLSQETMKLYKEEKANPFASCLPLLLQSPVFFALFRTLDGAAKIKNGHLTAHGFMSYDDALSLYHATLFGAGLADTFTHAPTATVKVITIVLIIAMSFTTFITQRQLTRKNMPASAMTGPMAQQQKLLLYGYPLFFAVTGINFPIGVLLYWLTTNLWTSGQQYYVIKRNPTPGSPAWDEFQARKAAEGAAPAIPGAGPAVPEESATPAVVRQQPRKTTRSQRGGGLAGPVPATSGAPSTSLSPRPGASRPSAGRTGTSTSGTRRTPTRPVATRPDGARPDGARTKGARTGATGTGATGTGVTGAGVARTATDPATGAARAGAGRAGAGKPGAGRPGTPGSGAPGSGTPRSGAPRSTTARPTGTTSGAPRVARPARPAGGGASAVRRPTDDDQTTARSTSPRAPR